MSTNTTSTIDCIEPTIHYLEVTPKKMKCPECQSTCKHHQKRKEPRKIWDICLEGPVLLYVFVATYYCQTCASNPELKSKGFFESHLSFAPARGHYTYRVIEKATLAIDRDQMAFCNIGQRLLGDFHVFPSLATIWRWWREHDFSPMTEQEYEDDVCNHFSNILCIDELYEGRWIIVTATDPYTDRVVGQWKVEKQEDGLDSIELKAMLLELKGKGLFPEVVMTDESNLYPKVLKEVWPEARHALCLFHWTRNVVKDVTSAVRAFSRTLPKPKKRGRGRPKKRGRPRKDKEKREAIKEVRDGRYLIVTNPENLTEESREQLEILCEKYEVLRLLRQFMEDYYSMMEVTIRPSTARKRHQAMLQNKVYAQCSYLKDARKRIEKKEKYEQLWVHLHYKSGQTTNNHVERVNRKWRRRQKSHYRLRSAISIDRMLSKERRKQGKITESIMLQKRFGRPKAKKPGAVKIQRFSSD